MELPKRSALEFKYARQLSQLTTQQRIKLGTLLGFPPDLNNVPDSFWEELEEEHKRNYAAWWGTVFLASAVLHGLDKEQAQRDAETRALAAAESSATSFRQTTQEKLDQIADDWIANRAGRQDVKMDLIRILGPSRVSNVVITGITDAQTAGGESAVSATGGISEEDLWVTENDGKVCNICQPLHMTKRSFWSSFFPNGPTAHNRCRCYISYASLR